MRKRAKLDDGTQISISIVSGTTLIKKKDDYRFFRSIFWWTGVVSPHTPASGASAFEKIVFGSDVFGGDLQEFDLALAALPRDAGCLPGGPQSAQERRFFRGTMWRILQQQQAMSR